MELEIKSLKELLPQQRFILSREQTDVHIVVKETVGGKVIVKNLTSGEFFEFSGEKKVVTF